MALTRSEHIRPLREVNPRNAEFIQALVTEFTLTTGQEGTTLDLRFDADGLAVASVAGKDAVRRQLRTAPRRARDYQSKINAALTGSTFSPYRFSDPTFPFRYASGGILPIVHLRDRDYYAFFWRDIFPIGWNIANGGSESVDEMKEPERTVNREFREELVILSPDRRRVYAYPRGTDKPDDPGTLPVARALWEERLGVRWRGDDIWQLPTKWIHGPDSVQVTYADHKPARSSGYFLNINTEDFGIEVDRVARIRVEGEALLLDGEMEGNDLLDQPVGLFETDRTDSLVRSGATDFRPDRFFFGGRPYEPQDLVRIINKGYLASRSPRRSEAQRKQLESQPNWFDLCPVTRQIISRYLAWEERISTQVPPPPPRRRPYKVFLCFKHEDADLASRLYQHLVERGLAVFYSEESIEIAGTSFYIQAIEDALDEAECLVVVGTRPEYFSAPWPRYEWRSFHNDILSEVKPNGRLFSLVTPEIDPRRLPRPLRLCEATIYDERDPQYALERVYRLITAG